jgi:hypothetical protein
VSRLLPEELTIGLFPGGCWLSRRTGVTELAIACPVQLSELSLAVDDLFDAQAKPPAKDCGVQLLLSDSIGPTIPLPWQERLTGEAELRAYALACFERRGVVLDDSWVVHADFRHFGASGAAFALPADWVDDVRTRIAARGAVLRMVMPVSASVYWYWRGGRQRAPTLIVLNEEDRLTALLYGQYGLVEVDAQSVMGQRDQAVRRLLLRLVASYAAVREVHLWSSAGEGPTDVAITQVMPDAVVRRHARNAWGGA